MAITSLARNGRGALCAVAPEARRRKEKTASIATVDTQIRAQTFDMKCPPQDDFHIVIFGRDFFLLRSYNFLRPA
jgi:hypothetical protein